MTREPIQLAVPGGEANLTEDDAAKFASMPLDAQAHISMMPPEMRVSMIRIYASEQKEREYRAEAKAKRAAQAAAKASARRDSCRRALAGELGAKLKREALAVLRQHGEPTDSFNVGRFKGETVDAIMALIVESRK